MPRAILVIANPIAGGGRARTVAPALQQQLQRRGLAAEVYFTRGAGDGRARAAAAGSEPWAGIVAVGGDGTVNEVLNGMPDPSRPLGVLPLGTANVLAIELRLPRAPQALAELVAADRTRPLAIGLAGERRFLLFCGVGVDGAVCDHMQQRNSSARGKRKWIGPILAVVRRWPQFALRATFADGDVLDDLSSVLVTRVRNYGGLLQLVPDIDVGDGQLHALCFRGRSRLWWMSQGLRGALRLMRPTPRLVVKATAALRIDGDAPFQIDGDFVGRGPVTVSLAPQCANVFAP
jgi:diacylglycerol kinase family enzyme